jgi:hypothetical protein
MQDPTLAERNLNLEDHYNPFAQRKDLEEKVTVETEKKSADVYGVSQAPSQCKLSKQPVTETKTPPVQQNSMQRNQSAISGSS